MGPSFTHWVVSRNIDRTLLLSQKFCKKTQNERISDIVFFRHSYLTQPMVTPDDQIVKAIGDLSSALRHRINARGKEEMEVLLKMNNILSNATMEKSDIKKKVTFKDPIPPPKIATSASNLKQIPKTVSSPR